MARPPEMPIASRARPWASAILGSLLLAAPQVRAQQKNLVSPEVTADRRVTFRIQAPGARSVTVKGILHQPDLPMTRDASGLWSVTAGPLDPEIYTYQFVIDGAVVADPANRAVKGYFTSESMFEIPGRRPLLASDQPVPHGVLHHALFESRAARGEEGVWIYTPPGYDPRAPRLYPVVYLLHGYGDHEEGWIDAGRANLIVDNLVAQGRIAPLILAMPYGNPIPTATRDPAHGYYERNTPAMREELLGEVIPLVERDYRADPRASMRAIAGLSMGGGQALVIGLGEPGVFRWVGGFSSAIPDEGPARAFAQVAKDRAHRPDLLWVGVGDTDASWGTKNREFNAWLGQNGILHTWALSPGGHDWTVWRSNLPEFLELIFR